MDLQRIKKIFFQQNGILAWIVCLGMLISNAIVQGINSAFGDLIPVVIKEFDSDIATVALIPSIHSAAYYFAGFICSILLKWCSFRILVFFGGVGSCIAFLASFYASSISSLTISYGFLGGLGTGIVYYPGLIACGSYFDDTRRALATGIATSGSGIGIVVIPLLVNYTNEVFGWRYSMLLLCFISPIISLVAMTMLPLPTPTPSTSTEDVMIEDVMIDIIVEAQETKDQNDNLPVSNSEKKEMEAKDENDNLMSTPEKKELEMATKKIVEQMNLKFDVSTYLEPIRQYSIDTWNLFRHPDLLTYCFSHGFFTLAYFIPILFLSSMMVDDRGISVVEAGYIIPIVGVATCVGKLLTGFLITRFQLNALKLHALYLIGCGIFSFMFTFCSQYSHFIGVAVLYGLAIGPVDMMIMECISKMFEMELVKDSVGFVMLVYAIGAGIGGPIGGWIYEIAGNFNGVFYFCAAIYLVAALFGGCALFFNRKHEKLTAQILPL